MPTDLTHVEAAGAATTEKLLMLEGIKCPATSNFATVISATVAVPRSLAGIVAASSLELT